MEWLDLSDAQRRRFHSVGIDYTQAAAILAASTEFEQAFRLAHTIKLNAGSYSVTDKAVGLLHHGVDPEVIERLVVKQQTTIASEMFVTKTRWPKDDIVTLVETLTRTGAGIHSTAAVTLLPDLASAVSLLEEIGPRHFGYAISHLAHGVREDDLAWAVHHLPATSARGMGETARRISQLPRAGSRRVALMLAYHHKMTPAAAMAAAEALPGGYDEAIVLLGEGTLEPYEVMQAARTFAMAPDAPEHEQAEVAHANTDVQARATVRISTPRAAAAEVDGH